MQIGLKSINPFFFLISFFFANLFNSTFIIIKPKHFNSALNKIFNFYNGNWFLFIISFKN